MTKPGRIFLYVVGVIGFWTLVPLAWNLWFGWGLVTLDQIADLRGWERFAAQTGKGIGAVIGEVVGVGILYSLVLAVQLSVVAAATFGVYALVRVVRRGRRVTPRQSASPEGGDR